MINVNIVTDTFVGGMITELIKKGTQGWVRAVRFLINYGTN